MQDRHKFEQSVIAPTTEDLKAAVDAAKRGDASARETIVAALCWSAFACPSAISPTYTTLANQWLDGCGTAPAPAPKFSIASQHAPLDSTFWQAFWAVIDQQNFDASSITAAVAGLGGAVDDTMQDLSEDAARAHPGAACALSRPVPGRTDLTALGVCQEGSLGEILYRMLVDNGYDLEVLNREDIHLSALPAALQYLNVRILQMHDVWHLVAGYSTSGSHEIAISAFQLAQFGHNYSAMFLAVAVAKSHIGLPASFPILMQLIMEAWHHGQHTPAMMDIEWENEWSAPIQEIRQRYGITPYRSVLPENLLETFSTGTRWERLRLGIDIGKKIRRLRRGQSLCPV